jgi:HK97 family phage major capsid protein
VAKILVSKATLTGLLSHIAQKRDNGGITPGESEVALKNATDDNPNMFADHSRATRVNSESSTRPRPADYDGSSMKWFVGTDAANKGAIDPTSKARAMQFASKAYEAVVLSEPGDPELDQLSGDREIRLHKAFHDLHDGLTLAQTVNKSFDPRSSKLWPRYMRLGAELVGKVAGEAVSKIMTTTGAGTGLEFIPNTLSGSLIPLIKQELVLTNAFPHMNMPTSPYKLPLEGADVTPYLVSQTTSDLVDDSTNTIGAKTPGTNNLTFTASKLGVTAFISAEASEDSLIDMAPFVRMKLARTMSEGIDTVVLNGDNQGSLDVDSAAATDYRRAWKGLRKLTATAAKVSAASTALTAAKLLNVLVVFGKFAQRIEDTLIIVSPIGLVHLYGDTAFNRADAYGATPPLVTGEVTKVFGRPVVVSGAVREDLNGSGFYDGSTTSRTIAVLAHRPSFALGDRRLVTVKAAEMIRSDRTMLVATWRGDFQRVQAEVTSGQVAYNVGQLTQINKNATF